MLVLINFANNKFKYQQIVSSILGKINGKFDKVIRYSPQDIDDEFYRNNIRILGSQRGAGYWLWKPYLVYKTLNNLSLDDWLVYADSGTFFLKNAWSIINELIVENQSIAGFELPLIEKQWTKKELFLAMDCDKPIYTESNQIHASIQVIKNTAYSRNFYRDLLHYSQNYINITDEFNRKIAQDASFIEHRHDQSIFSLLYKMHGLKPFKDPTQYGEFPSWYAGCEVQNLARDLLIDLPNGRLFRVNSHKQKYNNVLYQFRDQHPIRSYISALRYLKKYQSHKLA